MAPWLLERFIQSGRKTSSRRAERLHWENAYQKGSFFMVNPFSVMQDSDFLVQCICKRLQHIFLKDA
jgi:hypothetical protein